MKPKKPKKPKKAKDAKRSGSELPEYDENEFEF